MTPVPVITGLGLSTPLGATAPETWSALLADQFITDHARARGGDDRIVGLALGAAREALAHARWTDAGARPGRTALVLGTSKGAVEAWLTPLPHIDASEYETAGRCARWGLAGVAAAIREEVRLLDGPALTVSAACASGLHALVRGALMIRGGEADRVLVVAAEASVHPLFLGSFRRLGVLPREGLGCRPFDESREGFLMSEAAAAVCLESAEAPRAGRVIARVERVGFGADATHVTGADPDGGTLRHLLGRVVDGRPVDLIHAHGTGTALNDPLELAAFDDLCAAGARAGAGAPPVVYSHKGALGHSLGAAGLVSVALSCLMHQHGLVPPNVQTRTPLPTRHVRLPRETVQMPVRRSIATAAGFGGATAVVSLVSA